ncbi:transketolase [Hasllibacter halocynthiae]|uniref:Transketolase n=1 Tax=Hasllibacter halocynthiae TaxID=595589 RepID=A0A2T0X9B1_9RHOB|nr:transketolase [Hasllibacter halocynthiae]PRY95519.1 transketolase [Hasllibacter halocynthiae]
MDIAALREAHPDHWRRAAAIRTLTLDAVAAANSGHSGAPIGLADVATVLWSKHLKFDAAHPQWPDRDRFILSNGHASMLIYALTYLTGMPGMDLQQIKDFRQWGSKTAGHPERGHAPGVETTTGPLGQGLANAVGKAMAEAHLRAVWGEKVVDHHTFVFAGDGCLMEGISHEAIALAGMQKLDRLIVFFDHNGITIDGKVSLADITDQRERFDASGWDTFACDGHDPDDIDRAIREAKASPRPAMIECRTHIALGAPQQDTAKGHGAITKPEDVAATKEAYGMAAGSFVIEDEVKSWWEEVGARGGEAHAEWRARLDKLSKGKRAEWDRVEAGEAPRKLQSTIRALKKQAVEAMPKLATRAASEKVLEVVNPIMPETFGGSADLTGSNNTQAGGITVFDPENRAGRYVHYGIREHGMAAAMNGIVTHGGLRPYGGTFLVFSDYARGAIRLSSLMAVPTVYVMTHDSIGLGEDGPTHQPVEHLAALRAMPNHLVIRPADQVETAEAWEIALTSMTTPVTLALSRQGLPAVRSKNTNKNLVSQGAYVLAEAEAKRQVVLMASGSEVSVAMDAKAALEADGIGARVVSVPCMELFWQQDESYRRRVLPGGAVRVAVEAAVRQPWDRFLLGERGREQKAGFVGMDGFGASAPAETLFEKFGITADAVAEKAKSLL